MYLLSWDFGMLFIWFTYIPLLCLCNLIIYTCMLEIVWWRNIYFLSMSDVFSRLPLIRNRVLHIALVCNGVRGCMFYHAPSPLLTFWSRSDGLLWPISDPQGPCATLSFQPNFTFLLFYTPFIFCLHHSLHSFFIVSCLIFSFIFISYCILGHFFYLFHFIFYCYYHFNYCYLFSHN